jgi:hypothetical protein
MMSEIPPDWALSKALKLMEYGGTPIETVRKEPSEHYEVVAFARYIAEHEEPPVDPLLIEAREIASNSRIGAGKLGSMIIREGGGDDAEDVQLAYAALRRGMELAKQSEPSNG